MSVLDSSHPVVGIVRTCLPGGRERHAIAPNTMLIQLGFDSLELINLFVQLETQLSMRIDQLAELLGSASAPTLGALIDLYDNRLGKVRSSS